MTPAQITLARQYMALPGHHATLSTYGFAHTWGRDDDGARWVLDLETNAWLPDFTDDATGGVMLARLPGRPSVLMRGDTVHIEAEKPSGFLIDGESGATLAEAVARAAVALGRAG